MSLSGSSELDLIRALNFLTSATLFLSICMFRHFVFQVSLLSFLESCMMQFVVISKLPDRTKVEADNQFQMTHYEEDNKLLAM